MKSIIAALASFALASTALADAPAGAASANCDITQFTPIMSEAEPGVILYWNNPTCKNPAPRAVCEHDGSCELSE